MDYIKKIDANIMLLVFAVLVLTIIIFSSLVITSYEKVSFTKGIGGDYKVELIRKKEE